MICWPIDHIEGDIVGGVLRLHCFIKHDTTQSEGLFYTLETLYQRNELMACHLKCSLLMEKTAFRC